MAKRGPPPKPTALKIAEGNPGKRPLPENEVKPPTAVPPCPEYMTGDARKFWKHLVNELYRNQLMTALDVAALEGLCVHWERARKADAILRKPVDKGGGFTYITTQGNVVQRPEVTISRASWEVVRKFSAEFGLTPAARTRIQVDVENSEDADDDEEFFCPTG